MKNIEVLLEKAHKNGQRALTEAQCYEVFGHLGLKTPQFKVLEKNADVKKEVADFPGARIVLKISSSKTLHKTDKGGVKVCAKEDADKAAKELWQNFPEGEGVLAVSFFEYPHFALGQEIMLGARADASFGPLITLGIGGTDAEGFTSKLKPGVSPNIARAEGINAEKFVEESWIWKYTSGKVRGGKENAAVKDMAAWVSAFAKLMTHFKDAGKSKFMIEEIEINPLAANKGVLMALDGVLRFREAQDNTRSVPTEKGVKALLAPQTAAVAGVSADKMNMGRIILNNIINAGFPKENIYIMKPGGGEIDGVKCFASASDFPKKVDMYVVTVPAAAAIGVVEDAANSGKINGVVLISGGMGEKEGSEGTKAKVEEIVAKGKEKNPDFTLNGANSMGIVSNVSKVNTFFIPERKLIPPLGKGSHEAGVAFFSQSGAFVISTLSKLDYIKPLYSVTVGNQMDATVCDYCATAVKDDKIQTLLVYLEGLKQGDGARLVEAIEYAKKKGKTVVIYNAGRTPTGQKAVMGHTASIAGDYVSARALFGKAGAVVCETFDEFESMAVLASAFASRPANANTFMLSNAGFETSGMADNIIPGEPLKAGVPSDGLKKKLEEVLKKYKLDGIVDVRNPFDVTPMCPDAALKEIAELAAQSGEYGSFVFSLVPLSPNIKTMEDEGVESVQFLSDISKKYNFPIVVVVSSGSKYNYYRELARKAGLPVFMTSDMAIRTINAWIK